MQNIVYQLKRVEPVPTRSLTEIDGIAIHHAGGGGDPWSWADYHTRTPENGGPSWGPAYTIGYHAVVMLDGTVYKTAFDRDRTPGVANHNRHLLHICLQGDLSKTYPSFEQLRGLMEAIKEYRTAYPAITLDRVRTHGEWQDDPAWATSCPGIPSLGHFVRYMLGARGMVSF